MDIGRLEVSMTDRIPNTLEPSRTVRVTDLVQVNQDAIVSRTLAKTTGGTVTLFAFDAGQSLSEHSAPFDALVQVLDGALEVTIAGEPMTVQAGELVLMPADVPHALTCTEASRMLLTMLRGEAKE